MRTSSSAANLLLRASHIVGHCMIVAQAHIKLSSSLCQRSSTCMFKDCGLQATLGGCYGIIVWRPASASQITVPCRFREKLADFPEQPVYLFSSIMFFCVSAKTFSMS